MTIKEKIDKFANSSYFITITTIVMIFGYEFNLSELSIAYLAVMAMLVLLYTDDVTPTFIIPLYSPLLMSRQFEIGVFQYIFYGAIAAMLIVSIVIFIYRQVRINKRKFIKGEMFWAGFGICIVGVIAGLGYMDFAYQWWWRQILYPVVLFSYYLFFINFTRGDNRRYIAKLFLGLSCFIMVQMLWCILASPNPIATIQNKMILVGPSNMINMAGTMLSMTIPFCFYLAIDSKRDWLYCILGLLIYLFLILSNSRGNILIATLLTPIGFLISMVKSKSKKRYFIILICACVCLVGLIVMMIIYRNVVFGMLARLGLSSNGRFEIWKAALKLFTKTPIFGTGFYVKTSFMNFDSAVYQYHSTIIQIITCTGIVGSIFFGYYYYKKFKVFFTNKSLYKIFAFLSMLSLEIYGLIDMVGIYPSTILLTLVLLISAEKEEKVEEIKTVKEELESFKSDMQSLNDELKASVQARKEKIENAKEEKIRLENAKEKPANKQEKIKNKKQ